MQPLEKSLRNKLERTVREARDIAEAAARASLEQLGVGEASPYSHLSDTDKELRRKLRVHGRQLGDVRNTSTEVQEISRLIEEVAYEHWHRMLFARFLAENNLLMFDGVAVTLEECDDLAADEGAANGWELAARCAAKMLPQIFRPDSPVFQLHFAANHQIPLEKLISDLPQEVFTASDSLGWVYQYWQAKKKEEVNASEVKIGSRELPAVTQLFTEPYMVAFLLDNTLGAWWVAKLAGLKDGIEFRPGACRLLQTAETEDELREFFSLTNVPLMYLRFVKQDDGVWRPAAGTFDGWPENLKELRTLDPCCGSGHFLVAAFLMLVVMRIELEKLSASNAVDAVLRDNIHGLELDQRCVELAAFALAITAWRFPDSGGYRSLPELNVACSGLAISAKKEDWLALAGVNTNLRIALEELYKQFKDAPMLGSLINPEASLGKGLLFELKWEDVGPLLTKALAGEKDDEMTEMGVVAQGTTKVASLLGLKYSLLMTNFPFVGTRKQDPSLRDYCDKNHPNAKHDLSTCLIDRCTNLLHENGTIVFVSPHNWLFLGAYKAFRIDLLKRNKWNFVAFLGPRSFQTPMYDFSIALTVITNTVMSEKDYLKGVSVEEYLTPSEKADGLCTDTILSIRQALQLKNPDQRITLTEGSDLPLLQEKSVCLTGSMNGDSPKFLRQFWEFVNFPFEWIPLQSTVTSNTPYAGRQQLIFFDREEGHLREDAIIRRERLHNSDERGNSVWNKKGIMVHRMGSLPVTIYSGDVYDQNGAAIVPNEGVSIAALWCFLASPGFHLEVRRLDNKVGVTPATLAKIPFDSDHWTKISEEDYPHGLPKPFTDDPTQWIFHGHPCGSVVWDKENKWTCHGSLRTDDSVLQVAVARLLGYRWPVELDSSMELSDEARTLVLKSEELLSHADDDGIVCIPPVRGEMKAEDRMENLLAAAYGNEWSSSKKSELLACADHAGKTMETWLRDKVFVQHCKLFQHRPFIWHIWDGLHDGFAALVNYHKLDHKTLETLIYNYLGDWISRQKDDIKSGVDGAEGKLAAAEQLKKKLELILEGEAPYEIFVRWKPLDKQPVGWNPDLNDGVRLNIRPFITAGVLRFNKKPQINVAWDKDRGKDAESAPWYHLFDGDRINDHHLTLKEKSL